MKRAPTMADLRYLGTVQGPCGNDNLGGDPKYGNGLAIRRLDDGTLRLYMPSYNPPNILQGDLPATFDGKLVNKKNLGALPCTWSSPWGLFYDAYDDALYLTCHSDYDGDPANAATLSRGFFLADGTLTADKQWSFNRSDKMVDGGITLLPDGRFGVGFGGYRSVVATGPASMGAALAAFDRPSRDASSPLICEPLLGYPFSSAVVPRMHRRDTDYQNDISGDSNYVGTEPPGYTTWADWLQQGGVWVETENLSGLLMVWQRATGRIWYTNEVRAESRRYDLVVYDESILSGSYPSNEYQPAVDELFVAPGLPDNGESSVPDHVVTGVAFEPQSRTLVVGIRNMFGGSDIGAQCTGYLVFEVVDGPAPEPPDPEPPADEHPYNVIRVKTERQKVLAKDIPTAIQIAEENDEWTEQGRVTYDVIPLPEDGK